MRFSKSTGCFYPDDIQYPNFPADVISISLDDYNAAMGRPIGATIDVQDGSLVIVQPTSAQLLAQAQQAQASIINASCSSAITSGFQSSALGETYSYPSGLTDQANLSASVLSSMYPNLPSDWTVLHLCADSEGVWAYRPHSAAQIQKVSSDGKAVIMACLTRNASLQAQINVAPDVASVQKVVW
jgi:hypothetical protein